MGWLSAWQRFRTIRRLSRVLGAPPSEDIRDLLSDKKDRALADLLDLFERDPILSTVPRNGATRADLQEVYELLINAGAGQWIAGHYVPVATFGDPFALYFVLESRRRLPWQMIAVLLIERFERHDRGPVVQETRGPADPNDPLRALWELQQKAKKRAPPSDHTPT